MKYETRRRKRCFARFLIGLLLLGVLSCQNVQGVPAGVGNPTEDTAILYVEFETSSDWSDVTMPETQEISWGVTTFVSPDGETGLDPGTFGLSQDLSAAESGNWVESEAIISISVNTGEPFRFGLARGHIGGSRARLYRIDQGFVVLLGDFGWEGIDESSPENVKWFSVNLDATEGLPDEEALEYPKEQLDESLRLWISGVKDYDYPAYELYWSDAEQVTIIPSEEVYSVRNAQESIREELEGGPNPGTDYDLVSFGPVYRFAALTDGLCKYVCVGAYDGNPGWVDIFWYENRDGTWKIARQVLKVNFELPPAEWPTS